MHMKYFTRTEFIRFFRHGLWMPLGVLMLTLFLSGGCVTTRQTPEEIRMEEQRRQAMRERERERQEAEARRRIQLSVEDAEVQIQELRGELQRVHQETERERTRDLQRLESRISALEVSLKRLDEQRQKDREEIVDVLTQRIAEVMRQQQAASRPASGGQSHVVASGETLSAIAAAWGVSTQAIIRANNLRNADVLRVGQTLVIPQ